MVVLKIYDNFTDIDMIRVFMIILKTYNVLQYKKRNISSIHAINCI